MHRHFGDALMGDGGRQATGKTKPGRAASVPYLSTNRFVRFSSVSVAAEEIDGRKVHSFLDQFPCSDES